MERQDSASEIRNPKSEIPGPKSTWGLVLALTLVAALLRFYDLGEASFWVDELDFVNAAISMQEVGQPLLGSGYPYPRAPLLTYALMASFKLFGVSEFSTRLPSALAGVLTIPLVFVVGRRFFGERAGLIAAVFLTFAPFAIGWSRACRMYALFQLLFLAGMFFFYLGFEAERKAASGSGGSGVFARLRAWFDEQGVSVPWLLLGGLFLLLSYTTHQNAGLFLLSFVLYLFVGAAYVAVKEGSRALWPSKYFVALALIVGMGLLALLLLPQARAFVASAQVYQPKWAEVASAQNRWRLLSFFSGWQQFPINVLFVLGAVQALRRFHKPGVYALLTFLVPVLMFSFVFQYRKNDYVFHVLPLFYLLAAAPLENVVTRVWQRGRNWRGWPGRLLRGPVGVWAATALVLVWFPLTPTLRFGQKIPRLGDGYFNGAVYFNEWKEAAAWLRPRLSEEDTLISTLPQTVQYYLGRAEYNLNWSNGHLAQVKGYYAPDGRLVDFYSGADVIVDLDELEQVLRAHPQGWLLVDTYRFGNPVYVPEAVHAFVVQNMEKAYETQRGTVAVYRWNEELQITN